MAKIYYCKHCNKLIDREGFDFEVITNVTKTCPLCSNECDRYEAKHSKTYYVLLSIVIIFSIILFFYVVIFSYFSGYRSMDLLMTILVMLGGCLGIILGFGLIFSMFDINNIGQKLYDDINK
jgi:hypothetical protein